MYIDYIIHNVNILQMRVCHHANILHTTCDICARGEILEDAIIQNTHSMAGSRPSYSPACTDIAKMQPIFYRRGRATVQLQPNLNRHGRARAQLRQTWPSYSPASTDTAELQPMQLRHTRPGYSPASTDMTDLQPNTPNLTTRLN